MSIERVERQVSGEVQLETFICKAGYEVQKYLGLLATDTVTYGETEEKVALGTNEKPERQSQSCWE